MARIPVQRMYEDLGELLVNVSREELGKLLEAARKRASGKAGGTARGSKMISMRVPEPLLEAFKKRCAAEGVPYQAQIKGLMEVWLEHGK